MKKRRRSEIRDLDVSIHHPQLGLSIWTINGCGQMDITTFGELVEAHKKNSEEYNQVFGRIAKEEIKQKIKEKTIHLN